MKKELLIFCTILISVCSFNANSRVISTGSKKVTVCLSQNITIIHTNRLATGIATISYSHKNRAKTQFAIDQNSKKEEKKEMVIKLSSRKIVVADKDNKVIHDYVIEKSWIDKSGPETVYNLSDKDKIECSLTDYVDIDKHHYLSFRYKKVLETYYVE